MSIPYISIIVVLVTGTAAIGFLLFIVRSMFTATRGRKIGRYTNPRQALVVLDIQEGYVGTASRQPVTHLPPGHVIGTVNRLIELAERVRMEVVYVRQVFGSDLIVRLHGGRRQGRVVVDRRIKKINDHDFAKNRTDAFSNRQFEQFLIDRQVDELFLVGVDAAYCVYYTALGGINRGYRVTVVTDGVRSRKKMADVIERYSHKGIGLITSDELAGRITAIAPPGYLPFSSPTIFSKR